MQPPRPRRGLGCEQGAVSCLGIRVSNGARAMGEGGREGAVLPDGDASHPRAEKEGGQWSYSPCPHPHKLCPQTWEDPVLPWLPARLLSSQPACFPGALAGRHGSLPAAPRGAGSFLLRDLSTANGAGGCGDARGEG